MVVNVMATVLRYVTPCMFEKKNCCFHVRILLNYSLGPLKTKRKLLYLKTQFVPRSKHFSSRL